jgi:LemA protein
MSLVFFGALLVVFAWIVMTYNELVALRYQVQNAWKQIDVQLKRRYDLIPNLIETVKGIMKYEQETLQKVIDARSRAMASSGVKESAEAQSALSDSLGKVFVLMENYPELKANQNALQLQEELTTTENQLAFARQYYNDTGTRFNVRQEVFPVNVIAGFFRFQTRELFSVAEAEKVVPRVNFGLPA